MTFWREWKFLRKYWFLHIFLNSILQVPLCFLIKYLYTTSPFQLGRHVFIKNKSTFLMFRYVALFSKDCIWYFIITRLFWHLQIAELSNSGIKKSKKPPHLHFTFALHSVLLMRQIYVRFVWFVWEISDRQCKHKH